MSPDVDIASDTHIRIRSDGRIHADIFRHATSVIARFHLILMYIHGREESQRQILLDSIKWKSVSGLLMNTTQYEQQHCINIVRVYYYYYYNHGDYYDIVMHVCVRSVCVEIRQLGKKQQAVAYTRRCNAMWLTKYSTYSYHRTTFVPLSDLCGRVQNLHIQNFVLSITA